MISMKNLGPSDLLPLTSPAPHSHCSPLCTMSPPSYSLSDLFTLCILFPCLEHSSASFLPSAWLTPTCSLEHSVDITLGYRSHLCASTVTLIKHLPIHTHNNILTLICLLQPPSHFPQPTVKSLRAAALSASSQMHLPCLLLCLAHYRCSVEAD